MHLATLVNASLVRVSYIPFTYETLSQINT